MSTWQLDFEVPWYRGNSSTGGSRAGSTAITDIAKILQDPEHRGATNNGLILRANEGLIHNQALCFHNQEERPYTHVSRIRIAQY
jgi:hypothetical protein